MESKDVVNLLKALLDKAKNASEKKQIEDVIKKLESEPEGETNSSQDRISKKGASLVVDVIGKFFSRIGSSMIAKEILDFLHNHHW